uniref:Post-SET domain-containing protein n=1 Tax=Heliothis virescens TaxID=7102 RepID=A0A2A4J3Z4_HELVI
MDEPDYTIRLAQTSSSEPDFREAFDAAVEEHNETHQGSQKKPWTQARVDEVINEIKNGMDTFLSGLRRTAMEYYWMNKYEVITVDGEDQLIFKRSSPEDADDATKFLNLRPLKTNEASEILIELMKIFLTFGAPTILQVDNRHEFAEKLKEEVTALWPECRVVHKNTLAKGNNKEVEELLHSWMLQNNSTRWSVGCFVVQFETNDSVHKALGKSPYKSLFGCDPKNSEVTFNYNLECAGIEKKRCMCGAKRCSGYIGAKPKQDESQSKKPKIPGKRTYKKRKTTEESPSTKNKPKRPIGRPPKPRELTEIEKDLLIIRNATNGISSDESSRSMSSEYERNPKALKRKRVSFSTEENIYDGLESPSVKKHKSEEKTDVGD